MTDWKLPDHLAILVVTQTNSTRTALMCPAAQAHVVSIKWQVGYQLASKRNHQLHQQLAGHVVSKTLSGSPTQHLYVRIARGCSGGKPEVLAGRPGHDHSADPANRMQVP